MTTLSENLVRIALDAYWIPKEESAGKIAALWERVEWVCAEWSAGLHRIHELEAENERLRHEVAQLRASSGSTPVLAPQNSNAAIASVVRGQGFHR